MLDVIACCLAWLGALLTRTRACPAAPANRTVTATIPGPPPVRRKPRWTPPSPTDRDAIDGHALDIVRPYVRAQDDPNWRRTHEAYRHQQRQRRTI